MAKELNEETGFVLSVKTMIGLGFAIATLAGMWFTLQADIKEAKELPEPPIGRTEYDLKDQMIRNTIIETEKDVQEIKEEQKEMRTDVKNIERMLMQK